MRFVMITFISILLSLLTLKADIILGVVPQQSPLKLFKIWKPVADYLSKEVGVKVHFKTEKSIAKFSKQLYKGSYDMAYMSPMHFVLVNTKHNYEPLVRSDKLIWASVSPRLYLRQCVLFLLLKTPQA